MHPPNDTEIEGIVLDAVERLFEETDLILIFNSTKEDGFEIGLDEDGKWKISHSIDVLSLVLWFHSPIPVMMSDDNVCVGTIMKMWDKNSGWVRSFQYGIANKPNNSSSISGWFVGHQCRRKIDGIVEKNNR
jgi:hypothetical protein